MISVASRLLAVQSPVIPVVGALVRDHPGTISLGQGVVNYGPPIECATAIQDFLIDPTNHIYKQVDGIAPLRELITKKLSEENGITIGEGNAIVVTAGGNMAFLNALLAITDPGDEVILQTPYYFNHEMAITMVNCRPVLVPTDAQFQLQSEKIRQAITPKTRAVVTISPNNPTGAMYPENDLRAVNEICREAGVFHIHDEAYEYFTHGDVEHFSPGSITGSSPHTISLYSLSKAYGFASWRIGYQVIPETLLDAVKKIQDTNLICPPVISQFAAAAALRVGRTYCDARTESIRAVRTLVYDELLTIGSLCEIPPADGAFYYFLKLKTGLPPMTLVERLIKEHGIAVIPGDAFGYREGCAVRISYGALTPETAVEGIRRFTKGVQTILRGH
jgi:aspartate/methionine/tyrosine aminotransferase